MMSSVTHLVRDRTTTCTYLACVLDHAMNTQGRFTEANAVCQSHLSLSETAHDQLSALKTLGQRLTDAASRVSCLSHWDLWNIHSNNLEHD